MKLGKIGMNLSGKAIRLVRAPVMENMEKKMPYLKTNARGVLFERVAKRVPMSEINNAQIRAAEANPDVLMECEFRDYTVDFYKRVDFNEKNFDVLSEGKKVFSE